MSFTQGCKGNAQERNQIALAVHLCDSFAPLREPPLSLPEPHFMITL
jgi:hypothetical protein